MYFDEVKVENLLVVIQTLNLKENRKIAFLCWWNLKIFTFFSICVWDDDPSILSKFDDVGCWTLRKLACFINNCCDNDEDVDVDDGCPIVVHCFPPPIDPSRDDVLEGNVVGTVDTPPLLFILKKQDGDDDDELAVGAKCRYDMIV